MNYPKAIRYLESFIDYEKLNRWNYKDSFELERMVNFLELIGNPQKNLRCIQVAGTKGKGSTCIFIAYILRAAGYRVGLYTSPHLNDFRERIRILWRRAPRANRNCAGAALLADFEGMIPRKRLANLVERLKPAIEKYNKNSKLDPLTFFEVYTALAFAYFEEEKVDFCVLETGLGGRLDATNTVNSLVCAITPISFDHMDKLGNTLRLIAKEKSGIIKQVTGDRLQVTSDTLPRHRLIVVSAPQEKEAEAVIVNKCKKENAELWQVKEKQKYLKVSLLGQHQQVNARVAIGVIEALKQNGIKVDSLAVRRGLRDARWPGRCELAEKRPLVILDGAQNQASANALKKTIIENFKYNKLLLILGISGDKDIKGICCELAPLADKIIITQAKNPRAAEPNAIRQYLKNKTVDIKIPVANAVDFALSDANNKDLILVTGSLFVVAEARRKLCVR